MPEFQHVFRLGRRPGEGVFCGADGLWVGEVSLLERAPDLGGAQPWRPRPAAELNRELSRCYGLPIEIEPKSGGLKSVAQALGRGDLAHAQMVALHLRFPDPPDLEKTAGDVQTVVDLVLRLQASDLLKRDWNPDLHPHWPAGSPGSVGGQFAPRDSQGGAAAASGPPGVEGRPFDISMQSVSAEPSPIAPTSRVGSNGANLDSGVYYENGANRANFDNIAVNSVGATRQKIVANALENVGSEKWLFAIPSGNFGVGKNKCNLFVYDMLTQAGASPGLPGGHLPWNKYPPVPAQWADPHYHIPGWVVLSANEKPQPGDVVAQKIAYRDADGHVMIVGPYRNGKLTFIGTEPDRPAAPDGAIEIIPAKSHLGREHLSAGPLVFRRYIGRH